MKRVFDVVFSAIGIAIVSPVMALIALLIRMQNDGPVLFKQVRMGRGFREFHILKFRTMRVGAQSLGPGVTVGDDPRVTRVGKFLRASKLDELPQLFNVLRGDMSFVGPRPEIRKYVEIYRSDYEVILSVRPGITGPAAIAYRRESDILAQAADPEAHYIDVVLPAKIRMARNYVRMSSIGHDVGLICTTLVALVLSKTAPDQISAWLGRVRVPFSIAVHAVVFTIANASAFAIRFEPQVPAVEWTRFAAMLPLLLALRISAFHAAGLHHTLWRHAGIRAVLRSVLALAASSTAFWLALALVPGGAAYSHSVIVIDMLLSIVILTGLRLARQEHVWLGNERRAPRGVLVALGGVGEDLVKSVAHEATSGYDLIGVVAPDDLMSRTALDGTPVVGSISMLESIIQREDPDEILVAGETPEEMHRIEKIAGRHGKRVRVIHGPQARRTHWFAERDLHAASEPSFLESR